MKVGDLYQFADWKNEKHIPAIEAPKVFKKGELTSVRVVVGAEIPHPNTTAHHIAWIQVFFKPEGEKFAIDLGRFNFNAHGASTAGPDSLPIYSEPDVTLKFKTEKPGQIIATSYCNIHGLWENSWTIEVE